MQQFKRADPERLKHEPEERSPGAAAEGSVPKSPREQAAAGNGCEPVLSATDSDAAVALALQHEFGQEAASARGDDLEEKGLFFCQICQKNLSTMSVARREQHVNRWERRGRSAPSPVLVARTRVPPGSSGNLEMPHQHLNIVSLSSVKILH